MRQRMTAAYWQAFDAIERELDDFILWAERFPEREFSPFHRARLEALVRTETMRAYRGAQLEAYAASGVQHWRWNAAKSRRTCLACLAMDGRIFPITEPFNRAHVSCQCSASPVPDADIVAPLTDEERRELGIQTGREWFASQGEDVQREMLPSRASYAAFERGDITLDDFVGERHDPVWGTSVYQRSGSQALRRSRVLTEAKDSVPTEPGELIEWRTAVPESVQRIARFPQDVATLKIEIYQKLQRKHANELPLLGRASELLDDWVVMVHPHPASARWSVFSRHEDRWVVTVLGRVQRAPGIWGTEIVSFYVAEDTWWIKKEWGKSGAHWRVPSHESFWRQELEK